MPDLPLFYPMCCSPLPGECVVGIISTGRGVNIHKSNCRTAKDFDGDDKRKLPLTWATGARDGLYEVSVAVVLHNVKGSLATLSTVIADKNANIVNLRIDRRGRDTVDITLAFEVNDVAHFKKVLEALKIERVVHSVDRI